MFIDEFSLFRYLKYFDSIASGFSQRIIDYRYFESFYF